MSELKPCPMRAENGNCSPVGGFCTSVPELYCEAANRAYQTGYHDGATEAMRRAQSDNEPLTLEQLREMDGEPVYLVIEDVNGIEPLTMWVLVEVDGDGIWLTNSIGGRSYYEDTLNDGISAYRRKPERSENE